MMTSVGLAAGLITLAMSSLAFAQATVKPDGQWRAVLGASLSHSSGNSKSSNFALLGDAVRATAQDKFALYGAALRASSGGSTNAEQYRAGGRYEWNITPAWYAFGSLDLERDKPANVKSRGVLGGGLGWHLIKTAETTFDAFAGIGYTADSFFSSTFIDGRSRTSYNYTTALIGEESTHKLSETTNFKQRLVIFPNLSNSGEYRATWDFGLAVAMTKAMNLTAGLAYRYNSEPGPGRKSTDTLFTTGIAVKFE